MKYAVWFALIAVALFAFIAPVLAQSPLPTPGPIATMTPAPTPTPINPPVVPPFPDLSTATLVQILTWLVSGGASLVVSKLLERWAWFRGRSYEEKLIGSIAASAALALVAQVAIMYTPGMLWDAIAPYWSVIARIAVTWTVMEGYHARNKPVRWPAQ